VRKDAPDFVVGEHDRQAWSPTRANEVVYPGRVESENMPVQKDDGTQRLLVGRGARPMFVGQGVEKRPEVCGLKLPRMSPMESDQAPRPRQVYLRGARAMVPGAQRALHELTQRDAGGIDPSS
jgi:hypothetical protein